MFRAVVEAYETVDSMRPFVRPTYNQLEVSLLPPYGDPEVHIPGELGTYIVAGLLVDAIAGYLDDR